VEEQDCEIFFRTLLEELKKATEVVIRIGTLLTKIRINFAITVPGPIKVAQHSKA
jgi:hypothetical protein